jgi:hypothetical protein
MADTVINTNLMYERLKYVLYVLDFCSDSTFQSCENHKYYVDFLETANVHVGDCTGIPCSCSRCYLAGIEVTAQNILNLLVLEKDTGHCDKKCLSECNYKKKSNGHQRPDNP